MVAKKTFRLKLLTRYVGLHVLGATALVLLMFTGVEFFIKLISESRHIGTGTYTLLRVADYVLMTMPQALYTMFPMIALMGALIGLGLLAQHSELIVMRASGMDLKQIVTAVMTVALAMVFAVTVFGESVAPQLTRVAEEHKSRYLGGGDAIQTVRGTWIKQDRDFIHIDALLGHSEMRGVTRYQFDDKNLLKSSSYAKRATYADDHWTFYDISETHINPKQVTTTHIDQAEWAIGIKPDLLRASLDAPDEMRLPKLYRYIHFQEDSGLNANDYALAFWKRLLQPIATAVMIFLAIPFIFGPLRTVSMGLRLVTGVIIGFFFYILNEFFGPFSLVFQVPPLVAAVVPTILFSLLGLYLLRRVR